jgi:hypothetical protein
MPSQPLATLTPANSVTVASVSSVGAPANRIAPKSEPLRQS